MGRTLFHQEASICEIKRMKEQMEQFARIVDYLNNGLYKT